MYINSAKKIDKYMFNQTRYKMKCSICLESGADFGLPNCVLKFHNKCIHNWFNALRITCLLCRQQVQLYILRESTERPRQIVSHDFLRNLPPLSTTSIVRRSDATITPEAPRASKSNKEF